MDQVRPLPTESALRPRVRRLVGLSSSDPIRWRLRADPVQKRDPATGQRKKGLTNRGPLQKGGQSEACPPSCANVKPLWWAPREERLLPTLRVLASDRHQQRDAD